MTICKQEDYSARSVNRAAPNVRQKSDEFVTRVTDLLQSPDEHEYTTVNGSSCFSPLNPTTEKIGENNAYSLILVGSLVGNSFIGIIVYKTQMLCSGFHLCKCAFGFESYVYTQRNRLSLKTAGFQQ